MAITTWLNDTEADEMTKLTDPDLNALFQEVRDKITKRLHVEEREIRRKRFLRKDKVKTVYTLYNELGRPDYQIMNFYSEGLNTSSINTHISKPVLMAYFYGILYNAK